MAVQYSQRGDVVGNLKEERKKKKKGINNPHSSLSLITSTLKVPSHSILNFSNMFLKKMAQEEIPLILVLAHFVLRLVGYLSLLYSSCLVMDLFY